MPETVQKTCSCGAVFELEVPDTLITKRYREMLVNMIQICDDCEVNRLKQLEDEHEITAHERFTKRLLESGLPEGLRKLTFKDISPFGANMPAFEAASEWTREGRGLFLAGPIGTGKTWMAAAAAREVLKVRPLRWITVPGLMLSLRKRFNDEDRERALQLVTGHQALILDDIDKTQPTDTAKEVLFEAIDQRITAGAPLLITANLPLSALVERLGNDEISTAIASRINGYCRSFVVAGEDRRTAA